MVLHDLVRLRRPLHKEPVLRVAQSSHRPMAGDRVLGVVVVYFCHRVGSAKCIGAEALERDWIRTGHSWFCSKGHG